ncbi:UNVERIFIED_CONTAM: N6-adenosine-methyltransferase subunit mettl3 [Siphonaria sp. JEL0065]|nr:N6-adenosine-methyltransferase subunit mettl3 [Siphonaria sp. JEL0065]
MQQQTAKHMLTLTQIKLITASSKSPPFREFCEFGIRSQCKRTGCDKVHLVHIIMPYTDASLGDCSYLNTCHRIRDGCKFLHYEVDPKENLNHNLEYKHPVPEFADLQPAQWLECDVRKMDLTKLGTDYSVIMMDPPWDIHMQLPYGTMTDDEMKSLSIGNLQQSSGGFLFLWVTGRAMELARLCLEIWGYRRVDEIVWIKTNQLQRIIRTGRTGHWLNHGKEHCIVALKGGGPSVVYNAGLDSDVIVAEVRETSRKPDEIYNLIERLCPGGKKLEIFGRRHNTRPGWLTLGNQLGGSSISDPELKKALYGAE